jgi:hypothetical protein
MSWNLVTSAGRVDIIFRPVGIEGYDTLRAGAVRFIARSGELLVASLPDILRSKEAADRPQDRQDAVILRELIGRDEADPLGPAGTSLRALFRDCFGSVALAMVTPATPPPPPPGPPRPARCRWPDSHRSGR